MRNRSMLAFKLKLYTIVFVTILILLHFVYITSSWDSSIDQCKDQIPSYIYGIYISFLLAAKMYASLQHARKNSTNFCRYNLSVSVLMSLILLGGISLLFFSTLLQKSSDGIQTCSTGWFERGYLYFLSYVAGISGIVCVLYTLKIFEYIGQPKVGANFRNGDVESLVYDQNQLNPEESGPAFVLTGHFARFVDHTREEMEEPKGLSIEIRQKLPKRHVEDGELFKDCCIICLEDFETKKEREISELPVCRHLFHYDCIDKWLTANKGCPFCRTEITEQHVQVAV